MNLNAAFYIAGTGLAANGRATAVVSSNIANALTDGYARREAVMLQTYAGRDAAGVRVGAVLRQVDPRVLAEARIAGGSAAGAGILSDAALRAEKALGTTGGSGSLSGRLARLEATFAEAALRPDSEARLADVADALADVTRGFAAAADTLQTLRIEADAGIASDVARLNAGLRAVEAIDSKIVAMMAAGDDVASLQDERQAIITDLATIVPLREVPQTNGPTLLVTTGGLVLRDSNAAQVEFQPTRRITAEMTPGAPLSGLVVDGLVVDVNAMPGLMDGGTLAARFALRDRVAPAAQAELDALARDLVERLSDPAVDPTIPVGAPGLLTDGGLAFDPVNEAGLSTRLTVNPLIDPAQGGARFRLRDGLGAPAAGPVGDGALFARTAAALDAPRATASLGVPPGQRSLTDLTADIMSLAATRRLNAERIDAQATAQATALTDAVAADGVNTDAEMQKLIMLEQAFAANARVLSVVDALFAELLEAVR